MSENKETEEIDLATYLYINIPPLDGLLKKQFDKIEAKEKQEVVIFYNEKKYTFTLDEFFVRLGIEGA